MAVAEETLPSERIARRTREEWVMFFIQPMYILILFSLGDRWLQKTRQRSYPGLGTTPYALWLAISFSIFLTALFGTTEVHADTSLAGAVPLIRSYSNDEIGASTVARSLLETPDGTLYVGADQLLVFDGGSWSQVPVENTSTVNSLCQVGSRLWVGGLNEIGYFDKNSEGTRIYTSAKARLGSGFSGTVMGIFRAENALMFVTEQKVALLPDQGEARIWELPNVTRLRAFEYEGTVYVGQALEHGGKVWTLKEGTLELETSFEGKRPQIFGRTSDSWIYMSHDYRLYERNIRTAKERCLYDDDAALRAMSLSSVACRDSIIYLTGTTGGVLIIERDGKVRRLGKKQGLETDYCSRTAPSRAGGMWVATGLGISFVASEENAVWLPLPTYPRSILGDRNDLWVGTAQSAMRFTPEKTEEIPELKGAITRIGSEIFSTAGGKIYRASGDPLVVSEWGEIPGTTAGIISAGLGSDPALYVVNLKDLARIEVQSRRRTNVVLQDRFTYLLQTPDHRIWTSTIAGDVLVFDEKLEKGTVQLSGQPYTVMALHEAKLVLLQEHTGFFTIDEERIHNTEGAKAVTGTENGHGPAWIYAQCGDDNVPCVGVVARTASGLRWQRKNIPDLRRLNRAHALYRNGNDLWIGGDTGMIQVDVTKLDDAVLTLPPVESIVSRSTKKKKMRNLPVDNQALVLAHAEQEITLKFKTHIWGLLEPPSYESRLLPIEEDWTSHKYGEPVSRKNLPAGKYTLQLRAQHLGEVGQIVEIPLRRLPPWYLSYVGITVIALGVIVSFYIILRLRVRQIERKNRQLEEKIQDRTRELAKANAAKSEFLAAMSHEIRNPMNGVIGITKILQEAKLGAREKYYLTTLHRCAEQLRTTVDDVLDFSKIEAGEITLHPDTFDLSETIHSTIAALDLTGDRIEFTSWAGPRPIVTGDQGKLRQILTNYLSNALKYGVPPRAAVDVFVLDDQAQHCSVTIAVRNPGPDLPAAEIPKLFESFTRGEYAKVRRIGGNGLGLSICKKYAEAMGGTVAATSAGGLTTFQLTVPFEVAATRDTSENEAKLPKKLHGRALAIEDEDYNRIVLGSILTKLGYKVDWASDGKTAEQLIEQNGYDLVLTDWMLPDTDGCTLTKHILKIAEEPKPPVFAVTAYSTKEKELECYSAGMAGFISKPITLEKLEAALQSWASGRKSIGKIAVEEDSAGPAVSLQQLGKLGPLEFVLPDFVKKIEEEWHTIETLLENRPIEAANTVHKLISATLLVEADIASDQLRLLENRLRAGEPADELKKLADICREEIERVAISLRAALKRRQRINEAQTRK